MKKGLLCFGSIVLVSILFSTSIFATDNNDTLGTAEQIYDNVRVYGTIDSPTDVDFYKAYFTDDGTANFWLGEFPASKDYDLYLYDYTGTLLEASNASSGVQELITQYPVNANSWYYLKVVGYNGAYDTENTYTLKIRNYILEHAYAGVLISSNTLQGISADITVPNSLPNIYGNNTSVWVSTGMDTNGHWVQAGARYRAGYSSFEAYVEHYQNGIYITHNYQSQSSGSSISYTVDYHESVGQWYANIDGINRVSSPLVDITNLQAQGEVHKKNLAMGPFHFDNVKVRDINGEWIDNIIWPTADTYYVASGSPTCYSVYGPLN